MGRISALFVTWQGKAVKRLTPKKAEAHRIAEARKLRMILVLGFKPNPVGIEAVFFDAEVADTYRYSACPGYSACLDIACIGGWSSFTCRACDVYKQYSKHNLQTTWVKIVRRIHK